MDENKSINPENNTQNKEKVKKEKKKYDGFFKSLWNSIFKIEKYPELAAKGVPRALIYLIKLTAIFSLIAVLGILYQLNLMFNDAKNSLENDFPDFSYEEGILDVKSEEPIIIENQSIGTIIIDTKTEDENKINEYINAVSDEGSGIIILKNEIRLKTEMVAGTAIYNYSELLGEMGINSFQKSDVISILSGSQLINIFLSIFVLLFVYTFVIYFLNILTYAVFVSIFGCIANLITKLKMRYAAIFNMSIYAITLSTVLYMIYTVVNVFITFEIKYFEPMYISIATIYLVAAIFIIKSEFIKKQSELIKIVEVEKKLKNELENEEEQKDIDKDKGKEKEEEEKEKEKKEKKKENKGGNIGREPQEG